ncbi:hypothetical protein [Rhizobium lusitanum]|uniref:Uncharacterized protein n=1 Tax=Rhizobium lusitanum TaxID=293958 RepID=A0A7X0IVN0_9HYPH|nr:hypothetical protein [Rhizobium lusitanum]MBB6486541.1 hypothetical protein [Rhizobium lusitanum]
MGENKRTVLIVGSNTASGRHRVAAARSRVCCAKMRIGLATSTCAKSKTRREFALPDLNESKRKPRLSKGEKIKRLVYFCLFFAACFTLAAFFDTPWITNVLGCLVVGVGAGEINGISVLTLLSRNRDENDENEH